jgi:hypothetical protein
MSHEDLKPGDEVKIEKIRCAGCGDLREVEHFSEQERLKWATGARCRTCGQEKKQRTARMRNMALYRGQGPRNKGY